ncbi:MAG TPA: hypothetical protein VK806_02675, partial [Bacteroidia bacterium]|nr:hypothetical protein [Bacteroidia bacterium]
VYMCVFLSGLGYYYTSAPNPAYAYLINATNIASGHLDIGHFDHPGTTVQCFAAFIIYIQHSLSGNGPLYQDVLLHPESFLFTYSIVLILILGITFYYTGAYIYRNTLSIGTAILFQLTPMFTLGMLEDGMYMKPEPFIIVAGTFLMAYLYVQFIDKKEKTNETPWYKVSIITGILTGFLIASKINCLPIIILPFFLMRGIKQYILYVLTTAICFIICILPIISKFSSFLIWVENLITHDGLYGKGAQRITNFHVIKTNLQGLFSTDPVFTLIYLVISTAFIITIINIFKKKKQDGIYSHAIIGIWLFITVLILIVAKHYKFYYIFPAATSLAFGLIVSYHTLSISLASFFPSRKNTILYYFAGALSLLTAFHYFLDVIPDKTANESLPMSREFIQTKKNIPVIIATEFEAAYIEPSLYFGIVYAGNLAPLYLHFEQKNYPNSYLYKTEPKQLIQWDREAITPELFAKNDSVLVYFKDKEENEEESILQDLITHNGLKLGSYKKNFESSSPTESIYVIHSNKALASKLFEAKSVFSSDLEKLDSSHLGFMAADGKSVFAKANLLSQKEHHSGINSILLDTKNQFGLDHPLTVKPNYFIDATVWRKSSDNNGSIVLSAPKSDQFYKGGQSIINFAGGGWEQIECKCRIPTNYKDTVLNFYLYYNGNKEVYFDDVSVTVYPMK